MDETVGVPVKQFGSAALLTFGLRHTLAFSEVLSLLSLSIFFQYSKNCFWICSYEGPIFSEFSEKNVPCDIDVGFKTLNRVHYCCPSMDARHRDAWPWKTLGFRKRGRAMHSREGGGETHTRNQGIPVLIGPVCCQSHIYTLDTPITTLKSSFIQFNLNNYRNFAPFTRFIVRTFQYVKITWPTFIGYLGCAEHFICIMSLSIWQFEVGIIIIHYY